MKISRRSFFGRTIAGLAAIPFIAKNTGLISEAIAADAKDSKITRQGYIHDVSAAEDETNKVENAKLGKIKKYSKFKTKDFTPNCENCKFYKKPGEDGYGKCAMVGATAKPGKWVYKNGLCKVYAKNKKKA
jgi:hypothetical protein